MTTNETFLNDLWTLYFHDPNNDNWSLESYQRIADFNSVESVLKVHNVLRNHIHCGMFFLMREHVFPCWDDDYNKNGGCLSIKVLKKDMKEFWEQMIFMMLGETLLQSEYTQHWSLINGISSSPKKHFCIIKIWLQNDVLSNKTFFNFPSNYYGDVLYKSNHDNIEQNHSNRIKSSSQQVQEPA